MNITSVRKWKEKNLVCSELSYVFIGCVVLCIFCVVLCIFVLFFILFVLCRSLYCLCICVLNYCHRLATQLQLNISYYIVSYIVSYHINHDTSFLRSRPR